MESYDLSLKDLLENRGFLFQIPNYQRSYVWENEEISQYLKDITYCYEQRIQGEKYDHFFGQMIFRKMEVDKSAREILEVVDGQQRLTTITLTIAAIYRLILQNEAVIDESFKSSLKNLKKCYLISIPSRGLSRRKLTLSERDNGTLMEIVTVEEKKIMHDLVIECKYESQSRIFKSYLQIFKYLEEYFKVNGISADGKTLTNFVDIILDSISVVMIKPKTIGYSYALYQIVNDRGILLTSAELLKARTMELLHCNQPLFDECENIWNDILNDPGKETTKYLLWHYTAMLHSSPSKKKLHELYEKNLFHCYGIHKISVDEQEKLAKQIRLLYQSVIWCRDLSMGKLPLDDVHPQIYDMYKALIIGLKNEIAIPLYINMLRIVHNDTKIKVISFITVLISRFFFSARTIANTHNGSIAKVYNALSAHICSSTIDYDAMIKICRDKQVEKSVVRSFASKMDDSVYSKSSTAISKYLLYMIELFAECNDITYKHILNRDESVLVIFENLSTEHIAARSGADGNKFTQNERDCLGNLTLLGENKNNNLDDKPFDYKKTFYAKSPFLITRKIAECDTWESEEFNERQNQLKKKAVEIFTL